VGVGWGGRVWGVWWVCLGVFFFLQLSLQINECLGAISFDNAFSTSYHIRGLTMVVSFAAESNNVSSKSTPTMSEM
jgi:hypothetical protein